MFKFIKNLTVFSIVALLCAGIYLSFKILPENKIGIIHDLKRNKQAGVYFKKYNFVWQGALPWLYAVSETVTVRNASFNSSAEITGIESIKDNFYRVNVPVNLIYKINPDRFHDFLKLSGSADLLLDDIRKMLSIELSRELAKYFYPVYKNNEININSGMILNSAAENFKKTASLSGIDIQKLDFTGPLYVPEFKTYQEGLAYVQEIRKIEKDNEKQLKDLTSRIERERLADEKYYARLIKISEIIKQNPEMIKYIYIDKMGTDVKLIISSDKTGMPNFIGGTEEKKPVIKTGNIDNLK